MERREFIKIVCGLVGTWPIAAYAQQVGELRRIGVLGADATVWSSWTVAFVTRLRELGWTTGETIDVDYRWAGGSSKRVSDFTAEFLRRNVDVIVTYGSAATVVQQVTTTVPVVLARRPISRRRLAGTNPHPTTSSDVCFWHKTDIAERRFDHFSLPV